MVNVIPAREALARAALAVVLHLRRVVKLAADAVPHEVADDAAPLALDVLLDGGADVAEPRALAHLGDADVERPCGRPPPRDARRRRRADVEGRTRVAVEALVHVSNVDVHDVAVSQHRGVRNAVADDLVDARADALREALVVQRCGPCALAEGVLVDDLVDVRAWSCRGGILSPTSSSVSAARRQTLRISSISLGLLISTATAKEQLAPRPGHFTCCRRAACFTAASTSALSADRWKWRSASPGAPARANVRVATMKDAPTS